MPVFPLFGRELGFQSEFGHSENAVHRRANLVTHVRQELALGRLADFRRILRAAQFPGLLRPPREPVRVRAPEAGGYIPLAANAAMTAHSRHTIP